MIMKEREVEVQQKHTERLKIAVDEALKAEETSKNEYQTYKKFMNESFEILESYEKQIKEKILNISSNQLEEYLIEIANEMQKMKVITNISLG